MFYPAVVQTPTARRLMAEQLRLYRKHIQNMRRIDHKDEKARRKECRHLLAWLHGALDYAYRAAERELADGYWRRIVPKLQEQALKARGPQPLPDSLPIHR